MLNSEEEYVQWLIDRLITGMVLNGIGNLLMLGCWIASYFWVVGGSVWLAYALYAVGASSLFSLLGDIFSILSWDDADSWAQIAYIFQLIGGILTILVGAWGWAALFLSATNLITLFATLFSGNFLYVYLFWIAGGFFGFVLGLAGIFFQIASIGYYNWWFYGVDGDFDGSDITDVIALSLSY